MTRGIPWPDDKRANFTARARMYGGVEAMLNMFVRPHFAHHLEGLIAHITVVPLDDWEAVHILLPQSVNEDRAPWVEGALLDAARKIHYVSGIQVVDYGAWVGTDRVRWVTRPPDDPDDYVFTMAACATHEDCMDDDGLALACWGSSKRIEPGRVVTTLYPTEDPDAAE